MKILQINPSVRREGADSTRRARQTLARLRATGPDARVSVRDPA